MAPFGPPTSTLTLFMPGIAADYPHHALAADNLAILAYTLYGTSDFHNANAQTP
jgi:hypothetical protein